jgi:hypothetical protein
MTLNAHRPSHPEETGVVIASVANYVYGDMMPLHLHLIL